MFRIIRRPASVVAFLALFVSLSGGALAAKLITGGDVKDGSLTSKDLKAGSLQLNRLSASAQSLIRRAAQSGATGPSGTAGARGVIGAKGDAGAKGDQGDAGAKGLDGAKGDLGAKGVNGVNGANGANGDKGDKGDKGDTGANGLDGAKGDKGDTGTNGLDGAKGDKGDKGDAGTDGTDGTNGTNGSDGRDAIFQVASLSDDLDVAAPQWARRQNSCDPTAGAPTGVASITNHLELAVPSGDGGQALAQGIYNGLNGVRLKDVERIVYSERAQGGVDGYNAPYFHLFTEDYSHSVVFNPSTQPGGPGSSDGWRQHDVTSGTLRYDDDGGNAPDITWAALLAAHGSDVISQARIVEGCGAAYTDGATAYVDGVKLEAAGEKAAFNFGT